MTLEINALNGVQSASYVASAGASEQNIDINFPQGPDENYFRAKITRENVSNNVYANKSNMKLVEPFLLGKDHVVIAGDGKMTLGELRAKYGIPPKILSQFNGASLKDSDVVKDIKVPLEGIGWYELEVLNEAEAADYRGQRAAGDPYAGYDRAITNEEIKRLLK